MYFTMFLFRQRTFYNAQERRNRLAHILSVKDKTFER